MRAKQTAMCRGDGYAFIKLALFDVPATAPLRVTAATDTKNPLPVCWRNIGSANAGAADCTRAIVVVVPTITSGSLSLFITSSAQYGHLDHPVTISCDTLKWESRMAYRLRKDEVLDMRRQASAHSPYSDICLYFDRVIPDGDNLLLRAFIQMPAHEDSDIQLACFDLGGNALPINPISLSGSCEPSPAAPTFFFRNQAYSIGLPGDARNLMFFVIDRAHPDHMGFGSVDVSPEGTLFQNSMVFWRDAAIDPAYDAWFQSRRITEKALQTQRQVRLDGAPSFSLVMTLHDAPLHLAEATIGSVMAQSYADWQLVVINAAPENADLLQVVAHAAETDTRIRFTTLESDPGLTECLNLGIAASSGDFVCLLEEGDTIEPDALFEYARYLLANTTTDVLYCDEDKADPNGPHYLEPHFKPNYDADLLRCWNYIGHFACVRRSTLESVMPPTVEFDGAHTYNIILNAVERARSVSHVSRVLYHSQFSESQAANVKRPRTKAEEAAVMAHLNRQGIHAVIDPESRVLRYSVHDNPLVSIVIPNKDCAYLLTQCVRSILEKTTYAHFEIIIVENNSTQPSTFECYEQLEALDERVRTVTWPGEFNFSKIVNFGVEHARGLFALLLNNDIEVIDSSWLERMLGLAQRDNVGAVGAKLLYADGTVQHAGVAITEGACPCTHTLRYLPESNNGYFGNLALTRECSMVTGACLLTRIDVFNQVGGFNEALSVECNDIDYCLKLRKNGYVVVFEPTTLYHFESVSRGLDSSIEKRARASKEHAYLRAQWARECVEDDPYVNPNLNPVFFTLK